ncbi:putative quinol monooxygenase [Providencia sneebia]|uniref:Antibiotic biosynthesis monooxygenase n=1 Tax=Providencia sneebia DSM 19967 TaxID=1141660 RepID=K8WC03_9GAMM|nr:antibiotic biosynthesis monooxygenase [Providencia sneebia DSM 19967]
MSITIYAQITTENKSEFLTKDILKDFVKQSRRERGCLQYDLFTKENGYIIFEEWEDNAAFELHKKSLHFQRLTEAIQRDNARIYINFSEKVGS